MEKEEALVKEHYNAQTKANMKHRTPTISPLRSVSYYKTILGASSVGRRPFLPSPNCGHVEDVLHNRTANIKDGKGRGSGERALQRPNKS